MAHFKKGLEVHVRGHGGSVDTRSRYRLRSCGKKQATVEYIRPEGERTDYYSSRGQNYYITPIEEVRASYGNDIPDYIKTDWNQHFVLAGVDGWDPSEN